MLAPPSVEFVESLRDRIAEIDRQASWLARERETVAGLLHFYEERRPESTLQELNPVPSLANRTPGLRPQTIAEDVAAALVNIGHTRSAAQNMTSAALARCPDLNDRESLLQEIYRQNRIRAPVMAVDAAPSATPASTIRVRNEQIAAAVAAGELQRTVAERFGVSAWTVSDVMAKVRRAALKEWPPRAEPIAGPAAVRPPPSESTARASIASQPARPPRSGYREVPIAERNGLIVAARAAGESRRDIADRFQISVQTVDSVCHAAIDKEKLFSEITFASAEVEKMVEVIDDRARQETAAYCGIRDPKRPAVFCTVHGTHSGQHTWEAANG